MPFEFKKLEIPEIILIEPPIFGDERGFFMENYKKTEFVMNGIDVEFKQDNHSISTKGVLRGLHYQANPKEQAKLIRCIEGEIFDVAVDIRKNSLTFGTWVGEKISAENKKMLFIPEGFAHGFVVLSERAQVLYKVTNEFSKEHDRGIAWNDPDININWGIDFEPILSEKDKQQPLLKDIRD